MNNTKNESTIEFIKEQFPESCHVCLIFENDEQRKKIVSEYLTEGIKKGEVVRYFTDKTSPESVRSWLSEMGIKLTEAEEKGAFAVSFAENAYCPQGHFEPKAMINRTLKRYDVAKNAGYSGSRACGEMSWALKNIPGSDRLLEYEVLLNTITNPFPHTGMCQYDARLFDGVTLLKILQVHPYIIAQGQVVQNPYYIHPEEYKDTSAKD